MEHSNADRRKTALLPAALGGLLGGLALYFGGRPDLASTVWLVGVLPVLAALLLEILRGLWRGEMGLDNRLTAQRGLHLLTALPNLIRIKVTGRGYL